MRILIVRPQPSSYNVAWLRVIYFNLFLMDDSWFDKILELWLFMASKLPAWQLNRNTNDTDRDRNRNGEHFNAMKIIYIYITHCKRSINHHIINWYDLKSSTCSIWIHETSNADKPEHLIDTHMNCWIFAVINHKILNFDWKRNSIFCWSRILTQNSIQLSFIFSWILTDHLLLRIGKLERRAFPENQ